MKKIMIPAIFLVMMFMLFSCDSDSSKTVPTELEIIVNPVEDFYLLFEIEDYMGSRLTDPRIRVVSMFPLEALYLDDVEIPIDSWSFYDNQSSTHYIYSFDFPHSSLETDVGVSYDYRLDFASKSIVGSLQMPDLDLILISDFDQNADLNQNWELDQNPDMLEFEADFRSSAQSVQSSRRYYKNLAVSAREHSIRKSFWESLGFIQTIWVNVHAFNYEYRDGGLIIFTNRDHYYPVSIYGKERRQSDLLDRIIRSEIKLDARD
jgi:hypothetical protein